MTKKFKKFKKFALYLFGFTSITLIYSSFFINWNNNKQYWYSTNFSNKIDVREPFIKKLNKSSKVKNLDNNFELKLLLNPDFLDTESKKITSFNIDFLEKIKKLNLKYKEAKYSEMLPIVWFYFDTENDREFFVKNSLENSTISRFIVYKNEEKDVQTRYVEMFDDSYELNNYQSNNNYINHSLFNLYLNKNISIVNFEKQAVKDKQNQNKITSKVGAIELGDKFDPNFNVYFNENQLNINDLVSDRSNQTKKRSHSTLVSLILGGKAGVDKKSDLYLSIYRTDAEWQKAIEWMVVTKGVRVINHSYGNGNEHFVDYNENTYLLDFLARKYGVINVFAAGNSADENDKNTVGYNPWIDDKSLSLNSIVVGALENNSSSFNIAKNKIASYSNFKTGDEYSQFSKPLVVAPAEIYNVFYDENQISNGKKYVSGTSYAAPIVTGLISTLLREKPNLDYNDYRIPAVKSILSVSAISPNHTGLVKKKNGYYEKYGAGTPDFEKMKKAVDNTAFISGNKENVGKSIFTSDKFWVNSNERIKSSLSWMFNAGILKNKEDYKIGQNIPSWWWFLPPITGVVSGLFNPTIPINTATGLGLADLHKWSSDHLNKQWLSLNAAKKRQNNKIVSDYDLYLQKLNSYGKWVTVASSNSDLGNDELIDFKSNESGYYRINVWNYRSSVFENSVDDKLAVSYLVDNEN
ncbi:S8 family serine peptidase [Mesomycoplasma ovipneumoniae]|uniref:S8 family serine peptidase n=1 Tax=Mesomycoplasma ovipneumoniae TaxID=29562 RepID=A0AAJ2P875_9BACT|nr:S8 family serine peptidase [Mesomycoplasma ovipneumoniae]MDW2829663.1 S8 family serine peptidase [Mesomycoplasma ovipneumoniae]MDW2834687.1 S8 family serine peptidase [Mesomycoplasma ovipneumoniae]MDW2835486.1 S8 family serine peptidase [Mesomycoplasma ovipneumoniae]MDW2852500.1 S8 family serine peptidase [Mesomycoplasma ovipneumoniae]MDW2861152.1 S8 family serine peptidase [Mesomycoplasma ovipneumoniae]